MKVKELLNILNKFPDDLEVVIAFNGCTESGEILGITECTKQSTKDYFQMDDQKDIVKVQQNFILIYSDRKYPDFFSDETT